MVGAVGLVPVPAAAERPSHAACIGLHQLHSYCINPGRRNAAKNAVYSECSHMEVLFT